MLKRLIGAAVGCALISTAAFAAGYFPGFPIFGSAAYCVGYSVYSQSVTVPGTLPTPNQCNSTSPAGPTALTGTELIPLDTEYANGVTPQTALLPTTWLHAGYYQIVATGTSVTVGAGIQNLILNTGGTTMAVTMPAAPYDNQVVTISNVNTVLSSFSTVANTGQSFVQNVAPTNLAAQTNNSGAIALSQISYMYRASNTSWYRLQ